MIRTWLITYDITAPSRLRKVARACEDYGMRRQFSVFLCRLTPTQFVRLRSRLYDLIDLEVDQILFIPLCGKCAERIESLGKPVEATDARDVVVVV